MITLTQKPLTITLYGQQSINENVISPKLGVNVKLTDSTNPERFYTGVVSSLTAKIRNANTGVYTAIVLDGVESTGARRQHTITTENLINGNYGGYDTFTFTSNLGDVNDVDIVQSTDSLVVNDRSVEIFDSDAVITGKILTCKLSSGIEICGIIERISGSTSISVRTSRASRSVVESITLEQVTHPEFVGATISSEFDVSQPVGVEVLADRKISVEEESIKPKDSTAHEVANA